MAHPPVIRNKIIDLYRATPDAEIKPLEFSQAEGFLATSVAKTFNSLMEHGFLDLNASGTHYILRNLEVGDHIYNKPRAAHPDRRPNRTWPPKKLNSSPDNGVKVHLLEEVINTPKVPARTRTPVVAVSTQNEAAEFAAFMAEAWKVYKGK